MRLHPWFPALTLLALLAAAPVLSAQTSAVDAWRATRERAIVDELMQFVALPNIATSDADMRRNAVHVAGLFRARGFTVTSTEGPGAPVVLATLDVPNARGVMTLYIHYDGQPVNPGEWKRCPPFAPCLVAPSGPLALTPAITTFDPETRVYGRSTSDDKGPIIAVLNAVDALRATGRGPLWNLRVVLDGEEEAGSANFRRFATERAAALKADVAITLDGPRHPSGRATLYYGVRGSTGITVRIFGARQELHSGNYGNWAPDPSMRLAKLLASMKDDTGRVTVKGFYDDVVPLTPTEQRAIDEMPNVEAALKRDFLVAMPERGEVRLERKLSEPTLSVLTMESGDGLESPSRTAIPGWAGARLEMRLVNGLQPSIMNRRLIDHIGSQGYHVVIGRDPSEQERLTHPLLARVDERAGSYAPRVSMDDPMASAVAAAVARGGRPIIRTPTLGGSMPFASFSEVMPTVGISLVNHDNNQHGPDENLRLRNLWEGIDIMASVMTMERP